MLECNVTASTLNSSQQKLQGNRTRIRDPINMEDESVVLAFASFKNGRPWADTTFGLGTAAKFQLNCSGVPFTKASLNPNCGNETL